MVLQMSTFKFIPYRNINTKTVRKGGIHEIGRMAVKIFKAGVLSPHSGRVYMYGRASAPGEYPSVKSGHTLSSINYVTVGDDTLTVGTKSPASTFLRNGTRRMARRKMSDSALEEAIAATGISTRVYFVHG